MKIGNPERYFYTPVAVAAASLALLTSCAKPEEAEPPEEDASRDFVVTIENIAPSLAVYLTGTFTTPEEGVMPAPLMPGETYSFEVTAAPEVRLQLVSMFVESNDIFLAFPPGGVALWDDTGEPLVGDRSAELALWDAGTEVNEQPGAGMFQAPRQPEPGAGADEDGLIKQIPAGAEAHDGFSYPAVPAFARLEIEHVEEWRFRVTLTNVSPADLLPVPGGQPTPALLSPGAYTIHESGYKLFEEGEVALEPLESLAEDGSTEDISAHLDMRLDPASQLSPVVWALHDGDIRFYSPTAEASAGLEALAEDGDPSPLIAELGDVTKIDDSGLVETGDTSEEIAPGESVKIYFSAKPGDHLSFVTGYLAGNDKFLAVGGDHIDGIPLFDVDGEPMLGDATWQVQLLDAGTEVDEIPGLGPNQYGRQQQDGMGIEEDGVVQVVEGEWMGNRYSPVDRLVRVDVAMEPK